MQAPQLHIYDALFTGILKIYRRMGDQLLVRSNRLDCDRIASLREPNLVCATYTFSHPAQAHVRSENFERHCFRPGYIKIS